MEKKLIEIERCPKCGYEKQIDEEESLSIGQKLFFIITFTILATMAFLLVDRIAFNSRYINDFYYADACDYQIPKGWEIVSNGKFYAVRKSDKSGLYLYEGRFGITDMYITISEPSLFFTECKAKAYLKAYMIKYYSPKMKFN